MALPELHFFAADDVNGSTILELPVDNGYVERVAIRVALREIGGMSLRFSRQIASTLVDAGAFRNDTFVRLLVPAISTTKYFGGGFMGEQTRQLVASIAAGEDINVELLGPAWYLSRAILWDEQFSVDADHPYRIDTLNNRFVFEGDADAGNVLKRLQREDNNNTIAEFIPDMTITFDHDVDSNGDAWADAVGTTEEPFELPIGQNFLDDVFAVFDAVPNLDMTWDLGTVASPKLEMSVWQGLVGYTTDRTPSGVSDFSSGKVHFKKGVNIVSDVVFRTNGRRAATHALAIGSNAKYGRAVRASYSAGDYARAIGFERRELHWEPALDRAAQRYLAHQQVGENEYLLSHHPGFAPTSGFYMPGPHGTNGHYWIGDSVGLTTIASGSATPIDLSAQSELVTGVTMEMATVVRDADATEGALSWRVVADLNVERMSGSAPANNVNSTIGICCGPDAPDTGTPGTPPTAPTIDVQWSFTNLGGTAAANLYDDATHNSYRWSGPTWESNSSPAAWHDDYGSPHITWGAAGAKTIGNFPITGGVDYTFSADMSQRQSDSSAHLRVQWYNSSGTHIQTDYIAGPGVSVAAKASYSKVITAPATATSLVLYVDAATGEFGAADNIVVAHGGSGGVAGTPSTSPVTTVGGTGSGTYTDSGQYVPVGSVLELTYIDSGGPYIYAGGISYDNATSGLTADDAQEAIDELDGRIDTLEGGNTSSELHSHPEYDLTATDLTSAPEGGWSIQSTGNIVAYNGYTYIGYEDGVSGDCQIVVVANSDPGTVVNTVTLHSALEADDHDAPALLVRSSDHKLVAAYCVHGGGNMYRRISTTSLDTDPDLSDGFAAESDIDSSLGDSIYTYPTLLELTGESKIYLIYRQGANTDSTWKYSTSSDGGSTWAASTGFLDTGVTGPYMKVVGNGVDRFDIVCIDDEPNTSTPNVYHFYYDGSWRASDGTAGTLTFGTSEMTLVYDGGSVVQRPIDIAYDVQGNPRVLWASFESTSDVRYRYGRWTGSEWVTSTVVASGDTVPSKATNQRGAALDHANGVVVWGVIENADDTGSLYRFTTPDGGDTWESDLIHEGASSGIGDHNPQAVWNAGPEIQVAFGFGTFVDFDDYSLGIKTAGFSGTASAGEPTADAHIADTTDAHDASAISIADAGGYYTGTDVEAALQEVAADVAGVSGGIGPILISDTPSTPLVFGDLIQNEAQDDLVYADP